MTAANANTDLQAAVEMRGGGVLPPSLPGRFDEEAVRLKQEVSRETMEWKLVTAQSF